MWSRFEPTIRAALNVLWYPVGIIGVISTYQLFGALGVMLFLIALGIAYLVSERLRIQRLARERASESICTFVRALPFRELDTRVIRAVYSVQEYVDYPIRPTDTFEDYWIVDEDLESLAKEIAGLAGRDMVSPESNPYYNHVTTPEMLIRFLCAQPRVA